MTERASILIVGFAGAEFAAFRNGESTFHAAGLAVTWADDVGQAVQIAQQVEPSLLLLDEQLGSEVVTRLRAQIEKDASLGRIQCLIGVRNIPLAEPASGGFPPADCIHIPPNAEALAQVLSLLVRLRRSQEETKTAQQRLERMGAHGYAGLVEALIELTPVLNECQTLPSAAEAILQAAEKIWGWDCGYLNLIHPETRTVQNLACYDTFEGAKRAVISPCEGAVPGPMMQRLMREGPQLILRQPGEPDEPPLQRLGNLERRSASLMAVLLHYKGLVMGVLSIQSYCPNHYNAGCLRGLQALADHGAGVLHRIATEAARQEVEQRYRSLADSSPDWIYIIRREGGIEYANPQAAHALDLKGLGAGGRGKTTFFQRSLLNRHREQIARVFSTGAASRAETDILTEHGLRWIETRWLPLRDGTGVISSLLCISRDISDQKLAMERLQETLNLNQAMLAALSVGFVTYRASGACVFVNESLARLVGATTAQLRKQNFRELHTWRETGLLALADQALQSGQPCRGEFRLVSSFGREVWLDCHLSSFTSGGEPHLLFIAIDIKARKQSERLLELQRNLALTLGSVSDLSSAMEQVLQAAIQIEGVDCGGIYLLDQLQGGLRLACHCGLSAEFVAQESYFPPDSFEVGVVLANQPFYGTFSALGLNENGVRAREGLKSLAVIPLAQEGQVLACLNLASHKESGIPDKSRVFIEALAAQSAGALGRLRIQQALHESESVLRSLFDSPGTLRGIVELVAGDVLHVSANAAAAAFFGTGIDQLQNRPLKVLGVRPDVVSFWVEQCESSKRLGATVTFELAIPRAGALRWLLASVSCLGLAPGIRDRFGYVAVDISDRRQAELFLRELPVKIFEAEESERQRVSRELHDGVGQLLSSARFRLHAVEGMMGKDDPGARQTLLRCQDLLKQAIEETRRISRNLRPSDLDDLGLIAACRNFCEEMAIQSSVQVDLKVPDRLANLKPAAEMHLFRILQEALNNVMKHAAATRVEVTLSMQADGVALRIADNGRGCLVNHQPARNGLSGLGLVNMRERASSLGGVVEFRSAPGQGTEILVTLPCSPSR